MRHESMKKNKEAREPKRSLPEKGLGDVVYSGTKAVVGILPFGGTVAELISLVIAPPVQKRWEAWCQGVNDALTALEGKVEAFQIENLKDDPACCPRTRPGCKCLLDWRLARATISR